jgi:hypothetical protein
MQQQQLRQFWICKKIKIKWQADLFEITRSISINMPFCKASHTPNLTPLVMLPYFKLAAVIMAKGAIASFQISATCYAESVQGHVN